MNGSEALLQARELQQHVSGSTSLTIRLSLLQALIAEIERLRDLQSEKLKND